MTPYGAGALDWLHIAAHVRRTSCAALSLAEVLPSCTGIGWQMSNGGPLTTDARVFVAQTLSHPTHFAVQEYRLRLQEAVGELDGTRQQLQSSQGELVATKRKLAEACKKLKQQKLQQQQQQDAPAGAHLQDDVQVEQLAQLQQRLADAEEHAERAREQAQRENADSKVCKLLFASFTVLSSA